MTKRHCFVAQVGDAIEALASALDPEREPPFKGDILDLLEWAEKDVLELRQQLAEHVYWQDQLRQQLQEVCNAIGSPEYMDPPDGGSVTIAEQVSRMREDRDQLRQQVTLLRDALTAMVRNGQKQGWNDSYKADMAQSKKALAAADDLKGVRLCHAEPVVTMEEAMDAMVDGANLYRAWEPK